MAISHENDTNDTELFACKHEFNECSLKMLINAFGGNLDNSAYDISLNNVPCQESEGFIPYTNGGATLDILIPPHELAHTLESHGADLSILKILHKREDQFCMACAETVLDDNPELRDRAKEENPGLDYMEIDQLLEVIYHDENLAQAFEKLRNKWDDENLVKFQYGFALRKEKYADDPEKPFIAWISVNTDFPYFRDNDAYRQNTGDKREVEHFLSWESFARPKVIDEFRDALAIVIDKAMPGVNLPILKDKASFKPDAIQAPGYSLPHYDQH